MLGQDREAVGTHVSETALDVEHLGRRAVLHGHLAFTQGGHERGVAGQDAEVAFRTRRLDQVHVAEQFTNTPGAFVQLKDTIRSFKGIVEGEFDHLPEGAFYMVGAIEEAVAKAEKMAGEA